MFHEQSWTDEMVDLTTLSASAAEGCYICACIWRRYSKFTNKGASYAPRVKKIEYMLRPDCLDAFTLFIDVYTAMESRVGLLDGIPPMKSAFHAVLASSKSRKQD